MLRLLGILLTVLFAIGAAILTWPGFFRVERIYPIAQIVSFRGMILVGFAIVLVLALLLAIARPVRGFALSIAVVAAIAVVAVGVDHGRAGPRHRRPPRQDRHQHPGDDVEHRGIRHSRRTRSRRSPWRWMPTS